MKWTSSNSGTLKKDFLNANLSLSVLLLSIFLIVDIIPVQRGSTHISADEIALIFFSVCCCWRQQELFTPDNEDISHAMMELFSEWEIFSELRKVKMECQQEWVWYCHHLSRKIANIISVWARATSQSSSVFRRCDDVVLEHSYSFTDDCRCWYFFSNSIILCQLCSFSTPPIQVEWTIFFRDQ